MTADYTFKAASVVDVTTGQLAASGVTGVLRPVGGGDALTMYDLNGSVIPHVTVGVGAYPDFRADVAFGELDFGATKILAVSFESMTAAITADQTAQQAVADAQAALAKVEQLSAQIGKGTGVIVLNAGDDPATTPSLNIPIVFEIQPPPASGTAPVESTG